MKNILVCMKAVPSTTQVQVDGRFRLQRDGVNLQWNIADESALEAASRLRGADTVVTVLTMGPGKLEEPLRELFARGADRAVLLTDPAMAGADTHATANALSAAARHLGKFDLILCGRRAVDGETGQVPGELAAVLGIPCVSNVEALERSGDALHLHRRLEDSISVLETTGPVVVSICEYAYPLRPPGIMAMRRAKNKQVERLSAQELGLQPDRCGLKGSLTKVVAMEGKFPGLRKGPKAANTREGAETVAAICREVGL